MRNKSILVGAGLFGLGVLYGWAFTADSREGKAKLNREAFRDALRKQSRFIDELHAKMNPKPKSETTAQKVANIQKAIMQTPTVYIDENDEVLTEEEVQAVEEAEALEASQSSVLEAVAPIQEVNRSVTDEDEEDDDEIPRGETPEETRSNLQGIIDQYTKNPEDRDAFITAGEKMLDVNYKPPFVIPQGEYAFSEGDAEYYSKITLTYYPIRRVLLDEDEDPVDDVANMVGWGNLTKFGQQNDDPDVVFIRNERLETDFEVVRDEESKLPLHVEYGMGRSEFETNKAAGLIKFRREDL